jgi:hypothetical protein
MRGAYMDVLPFRFGGNIVDDSDEGVNGPSSGSDDFIYEIGYSYELGNPKDDGTFLTYLEWNLARANLSESVEAPAIG